MSETTSARPSSFTFPLEIEKFAKSGDEDASNSRGHAAVFDRPSHDLGGYRVKIAQGFFDKVLEGNPDVHAVWDHDTRYVLGRTTNKTLELRVDPYGLHVWNKMPPVSYADDLAVLMERGDIDQMSFACDIGKDEWFEDDEGEITRTLLECDALYDVTVCAQGAFPQTDSRLAADLASAIEAGRVQGRAESAAPAGEDAHTAAEKGQAGEEVAAEGLGSLVATTQARAIDIRQRVVTATQR